MSRNELQVDYTEGLTMVWIKQAFFPNLVNRFSIPKRRPSLTLHCPPEPSTFFPLRSTSRCLCCSLLLSRVSSPGHVQPAFLSLCSGLSQMPLDIFSSLPTIKSLPLRSSHISRFFTESPRIHGVHILMEEQLTLQAKPKPSRVGHKGEIMMKMEIPEEKSKVEKKTGKCPFKLEP